MPVNIKPKFINSDMTTDDELFDGLSLKEDKASKNQPNGYVGLNSSGKISVLVIPEELTNSAGTADGGYPNSQYLPINLDGGDVSGY